MAEPGMTCHFCGVQYERLPHTCDVTVNTVSIYYGAVQRLHSESRGEQAQTHWSEPGPNKGVA